MSTPASPTGPEGAVASGRFARALLDWHAAQGRKDLPWQENPTPYRVWVSEVMLQQTQVPTAIPYYRRFMARFPDVAGLAAASIDEVLHQWSGLGYYARARNLHRAARIVCERHDGRLPDDIATLQALPGIGRSTAGAILAIACNQRHAILDGNVKRVLSRYHAIEGWPGMRSVENRLWALAEAHTPRTQVGRYTQAIMDLGALLCTRSRPGCGQCPLAAGCRAQRLGRPTDYPAPRPRAPRPERDTTLLVLTNTRGEVLLERRPPTGIWGGLWSLPEPPVPPGDGRALKHWCRKTLHCRITDIRALPARRHGFSHFTLTMRPLHARVTAEDPGVMEGERYLWYNGARPSEDHGMAAPIRRLLRELDDTEGGYQ